MTFRPALDLRTGLVGVENYHLHVTAGGLMPGCLRLERRPGVQSLGSERLDWVNSGRSPHGAAGCGCCRR
jgi:hypothetical protein